MSRSTNGRSSFALGSVVTMVSCVMRARREVAEQASPVGGVAVQVSTGFTVAHGVPPGGQETGSQESE